MTDLMKASRLFEVSTRLQSASQGLSVLAAGEQLTPSGKSSLQWAGRFLAQVDRTAKVIIDPGVGGGMVAQVTNARPTFYDSLMAITSEFTAAGISSEEDVFALLHTLYLFMSSDEQKEGDLSSNELTLTAKLLRVISRKLLVRLNNNGLPSQPVNLTIGTA